MKKSLWHSLDVILSVAVSEAAILCLAILFPSLQTFGMLWFGSKYEKELSRICVKRSVD